MFFPAKTGRLALQAFVPVAVTQPVPLICTSTAATSILSWAVPVTVIVELLYCSPVLGAVMASVGGVTSQKLAVMERP